MLRRADPCLSVPPQRVLFAPAPLNSVNPAAVLLARPGSGRAFRMPVDPCRRQSRAVVLGGTCDWAPCGCVPLPPHRGGLRAMPASKVWWAGSSRAWSGMAGSGGLRRVVWLVRGRGLGRAPAAA